MKKPLWLASLEWRLWMTICGLTIGHNWSEIRNDGHQRWQVCLRCLHRRNL